MSSHEEFVRLQAEHYGALPAGEFTSVEGYRLFLMHCRAYEEVADMTRGKRVLDLGCNDGYGSRIVRSAGACVVGIDASERAITKARSAGGGDAPSFLVADATYVPFAEATFDWVVGLHIVEHLQDCDTVFREVKRVLVPGGRAAFATPNACFRLDPGTPPWNPFHVREFRPDELRTLLEKHFACVKIKGLFASRSFAAAERRRVDCRRLAARQRHRPRRSLRTRVKTLLPRTVLDRLRKIRDRLWGDPWDDRAAPLDAAALARHSRADLEYRERGLEDALDLLAICGPEESRAHASE
ncbi:MAG: methyltransferase domain-containing protein [Kiritimatiellae bacterium]|nr:methyltransferase domain-containing protein [Kiritimatiellia bacterium]